MPCFIACWCRRTGAADLYWQGVCARRTRATACKTTTHTLLRRCFYPRRDVIKWTQESLHMRLPCEVSNNVQGPLKSFCRRLRRGVGLTCVRTIGNNARDELVDNIETKVSCQLRLSSLLQHINPGYDMRFLGFVYCVFALPEY